MANENVLTGVLAPARLAFVNVFKPRKPQPGSTNQKEKYGVTALFPDPSTLTGPALDEYNAVLAKLKAAAQAAAVEKWGANIPSQLRSPFRDQGDKQYDGFVKGAIFLNATSEQRPGVVDANLQDIIDPSKVYSGVYARVSLRAFAYGGAGTQFAPGVSFGLQNIQVLRDGEPLGNNVRPQDEFKAVAAAGGSTTTAPATAGALFD